MIQNFGIRRKLYLKLYKLKQKKFEIIQHTHNYLMVHRSFLIGFDPCHSTNINSNIRSELSVDKHIESG